MRKRFGCIVSRPCWGTGSQVSDLHVWGITGAHWTHFLWWGSPIYHMTHLFGHCIIVFVFRSVYFVTDSCVDTFWLVSHHLCAFRCPLFRPMSGTVGVLLANGRRSIGPDPCGRLVSWQNGNSVGVDHACSTRRSYLLFSELYGRRLRLRGSEILRFILWSSELFVSNRTSRSPG